MKFKLEIECDNAAFGEIPRIEVGHILDRAKAKVWDGETEMKLLDTNGNVVGQAQFVEEGLDLRG